MQDLRERIISHCKWIATFDRDYAVSAFKNYAAMLPWLELEKKRG